VAGKNKDPPWRPGHLAPAEPARWLTRRTSRSIAAGSFTGCRWLVLAPRAGGL